METLADKARDASGAYDAQKLASLLEWQLKDIALYLRVQPTELTSSGARREYQEALGQLATIVNELAGDLNLQEIREWLKKPVLALDNASPQQRILDCKIYQVIDLVAETKSGFVL